MNKKKLNGFLLLNRSIFNSPVFNHDNPMVFKLYMYCLSMANHEDTEEIVGCKKILVKRGSFITTRRQLGHDLNASEQSIKSSLIFLKNINKLDGQPTNRFQLVTVCNYSKIMSKNTSKTFDTDGQPTGQPTNKPNPYYSNKRHNTIKKDDDKKGAHVRDTGRRPFGNLNFKTLWRYTKARGVSVSKRQAYIAKASEKLNEDSVKQTVGVYEQTVLARWDQRKKLQLMGISGQSDRAERATKLEAAAHFQAIKAALGMID